MRGPAAAGSIFLERVSGLSETNGAVPCNTTEIVGLMTGIFLRKSQNPANCARSGRAGTYGGYHTIAATVKGFAEAVIFHGTSKTNFWPIREAHG